MDPIHILLTGHQCFYDVQTMVQVFYPNRQYKQSDNIPDSGTAIVSTYDGFLACAELWIDGKLMESKNAPLNQIEPNDAIKQSIYYTLTAYLQTAPPWGVLTGIRPAKIARELIQQGKSPRQIEEIFLQRFLARQDKAALSVQVALNELPILAQSSPNAASLYVGIPFCPSRCLYCSFSAYGINAYRNRQNEYMDVLEKELAYMPEGFLFQNIYVGGGTPTSLNDANFERLMLLIQNKVSPGFFKNKNEFTVEAGRPDTITAHKLHIMKEAGVNRISINPQTMNNATLKKIGRNHTAEDTIRAFQLAREIGFDNINMDIIVGLPNENLSYLQHTLDQLSKLGPDGITMHTLAIKRASRLKETLADYEFSAAAMIQQQIELVSVYMEQLNLAPYYMYRQKNMLGNFENIGFAKQGKFCAYNIHMMEECHSILAFGAGAVTKMVSPEQNRHYRIFNVKSVELYLDRIDEMIDRKRAHWEI